MLSKLPLACLILAAGQGTRMRSSLSKVMHRVAGVPLLGHVINACEKAEAERIVAVLAPNMPDAEAVAAPHAVAIQAEAKGTGHAAKCAREALKGFDGDVIILFGDTPLVRPETLKALRDRRTETGASIVVAGFLPKDAAQYGRLVLDDTGALRAIVEFSEATPEQKKIRLCNGGIMLFDAKELWPLLDALRDDNAKAEFFLTDCIALANAKGLRCVVIETAEDDVRGINTRLQLAQVEAVMQTRLREAAMLHGVTMIDPASVTLSTDTRFGQDVVIEPNVFFGPGVSIGNNVEIKACSHFEKVSVADGATIGPFARLRPGAVIAEGAHIGNFVEIKNAEVQKGAKVNHLTYIGDAVIGEKTNVGAGTITCNYDGFTKSKTIIGPHAFIGSNTALVAPVTVGEGAIIGAGSTITKDVPANALAIARGKQSLFEGWAAKFREMKKVLKH